MNRGALRLLLGALAGLLGCGLIACGKGLGTRPLAATGPPPEASSTTDLFEVQGRLIGADGHGLPDLEVHLESSTSPMFGSLGGLGLGLDHSTTTDAGGYFRVEVPSTTIMLRLSVLLEGTRFFPWQPLFLEQAGLNLGGLVVPPQQEISGQVLDPEGLSRGGVTIRLGEGHRLATLVPPGFLIHETDDFLWLAEAADADADLAQLGVLTATTDEDGRFHFLAPMMDPWLSFVDREGHPHAEACNAFGDWRDIPLLAHPMSPNQSSIIGENDEPATKASVSATVTTCFGDYQILREQLTDAEGMLSWATETPLALGDLGYWRGPSLAWRQQKNAPWLLRSSFFGEFLDQPLRIDRERDLTIHLQREDGSVIEEAQMTWVSMPLTDPQLANQSLKLPAFVANSAGSWTAKGVPAGAVTARIEAPGMLPSLVLWDPYPFDAFEEDWAKPQTIQLHQATTPTFHVVTGANKIPVAGAIIQLSPWVQWSSHQPKCEEHEHPYFGNRGVTDGEGHWEAGPQCHLGAWIHVLYGASLVAFAWDGSGGEVVLELGELGSVSGTIWNQGIPAAELLLAFTPWKQEKLQVRVRVDSQGQFHLPILAGEYVVEHGDFGSALWTAEGEIVETIRVGPGEALDVFLHAEQP